MRMKPFPGIFIILFTPLFVLAQHAPRALVLRSDVPSKMALVSSLEENKTNDRSPVMIAAHWEKDGKQAEYRSLLQFDLNALPAAIKDDPTRVVLAELILRPVDIVFNENDSNKPGKITVKRVMDHWADSATAWTNQPAADSTSEVVKKIHGRNENKVRVDVTSLVIAMLQSGNKGFMITHDNATPDALASGELFASPYNEDEKMRPRLIISYAVNYTGSATTQSPPGRDTRPELRYEPRQVQSGGGPVRNYGNGGQ